MPTLAILGYAESGREVLTLAENPDWVAEMQKVHHNAAPADVAFINLMIAWVRIGFLGALIAVLAARIARWHWQRLRGVVRLTYPSGRRIEIVPGISVLEASRLNGIPHASVCGGRGRCSTCRVRVAGEPDAMPPPSPEELKVLERVGA